MTKSVFARALCGCTLTLLAAGTHVAFSQQTSASALTSIPPGFAVAFVDSKKVIAASMAGSSNQDLAIREANAALGNFARTRDIHLVVQEAVYADPSINITNDVIAEMQGRQPSAALPRLIRVAFVNTKQLFNLGHLPGESRQVFLERANAAIKSLAERDNIQLVLQKVVYSSPDVDLTLAAIAVLNRDKGPLIRLPLPAGVPTRVGFVDANRVLKTPGHRDQTDPDFLRQANDAVRRVAERNGIDVVLQEAVYADRGVDLTTEVLTEANK